jgi:voltage-gated potassium channel
MNSHAPTPTDQGLFPWLARKLGSQPLTARRSLVIVIGSTTAVTIAGGLLIRLLDRKDFGSIGQGMWWAVQTVTTVGYGDVVPHNAGGRLIGAVVMLTGIAFISLITASVTATLVEQTRDRRHQGGSVEESLEEISSRLEAIEARLEGRAGRGPDAG